MASEDLERLRSNFGALAWRHTAARLDDIVKDAGRLKLGHIGAMLRVTDGELLARKERGAQNRISRACFDELVTLEEFNFAEQPAIDRQQLLDLAELAFVDRCEAVLFLGPSGIGKTALATGIGVKACEAGYTVEFHHAPVLLSILHSALADESLDELLDALGKPDVLILDELGAGARRADQDLGAVFSELVHARYRRGAFVITSNFDPTAWADSLGNPHHVTAALDRLLDGVHIVAAPDDAPSYRAKRKRSPGSLKPRRLPASVRRYRRR